MKNKNLIQNKIKKQNRHIMIVAGEPSGDLHGTNLIRCLKKRDADLVISGIGGEGMEKEGMELFFSMEHLSAMGVTEVLSQFRAIKNAFNLLRRRICQDSPDLLILIDYPGFNLRAAAFAKKMGVRVLYYITPKVWAWKRSRIKKIKAHVDHAALIFPFEIPIFKKENIPHTFVGHPLMDIYDEFLIKKDEHNMNVSGMNASGMNASGKNPMIGLLPGSRHSEIDAHLELMLRGARLMKQSCTKIRFLVSAASSVDQKQFDNILKPYNDDNLFTVVQGAPQTLFKQCDFLVAASGTVTLEAAICGVPMVIIYRMSGISYQLARRFVKLSHVGLANIIMGREVIPELLQDDATPEKIAGTTLKLLESGSLKKMHRDLVQVRALLGGPGAALRTAYIALDLLK